ncbi:MAG: VCBS repeat-containing protein [Deltaproteobacteria bacterium]|nr:VCBS repeat-containing protein [Deltaproteobacteria bacterium]
MSTVTLGKNINSLKVQRHLSDNSSSLSKSFQALSSGLRINRASDDAAGLAVATALKADSRVYARGIANLNDGMSLLNIADGALNELTTIVERQRELAQQAANGSYTLAQRRALNSEANALVDEFNRIINSTEFNGRRLLDTSVDSLRIQAGYGVDGSIESGLTEELARNIGDGTFQAVTSYQAAGTIADLETADLNGDGVLDLVAGQTNTGVSVLLGNSDGSFNVRTVYQTLGTDTEEVEIADFNNDGVLDLITSSSSGGDQSINVFLGNGNGTFRAAQSWEMVGVGSGRAGEPADLNNDGFLDLIYATSAGVAVRLGNGDGTFKAASSFTTATILVSRVSPGDINGDGIVDLITNGSGNEVHVLIGKGDGTFNTSVRNVVSASPTRVVVEDFNRDGFDDVLIDGPASTLKVLIGNGDGRFTTYTYSSPTQAFAIDAVDYNGDGIVDLVSSASGMGSVGILLGNADGTFNAYITVPDQHGDKLAFGDFNGDGALDFASSFSSSGARVSLANTERTSTLQYLNINTRAGALEALPVLEGALTRIALERGEIGATMGRYSVALANLAAATDNFDAAYGRIVSVDVAEEVGKMSRLQILQNAATAILAQANIAPNIALQLLGDSG